jgi:hypothetical protein
MEAERYTEDALYTLIEELDPFPSSQTYSASEDAALLQVVGGQLLAVLQAPAPYPLSAPLSVAVHIIIGRHRAIADPTEQVASMKALVTDGVLGDVFVRVIELKTELAYDSVQAKDGTFKVGCGGFTMEQMIAVGGLWTRYKRTWPPSLLAQKDPFLLSHHPSFTRWGSAPTSVSPPFPTSFTHSHSR